MAEPRGFVVVGDTDCWDVGRKNVEIAVDARLRRCESQFWTSGADGILAAQEVTAAATPVYVELLATAFTGGTNGLGFGLIPADVTDYTNMHLKANNVFFWAGAVYVNGSSVESSLGTVDGGQRWGLELYRDSAGDPFVQFYKNGSAVGSARQVADISYRLSGQMSTSSRAWLMFCDGNEQVYRRSAAQPWGASARVADRGGYSPSANNWTSFGSNLSTSRGSKALVGAGDGTSAIAATRPPKSRKVYAEFLIEVNPAGAMRIGIQQTDVALSSLAGTAAKSWAYREDGQKINNSSASASGGSFTAGDYMGVVLDVDAGLLWFMKNGVAQEGDPEAGTGASYSSVTASAGTFLVPVASPQNGGRIRLGSHPREMVYRPAYAEAWDGADLLPEQHFTDRLKRAPSVRREVSYYQWANQRNRGAAIGNLDLNNASGCFDALSEYDLRDQSIIAYRVRDDGSTVREFTGLIDGVTLPDARTCRIAVADVMAKLQKRVGSELFTVGAPVQIPARPVVGGADLFEVASNLFVDFEVQTGGVDTDDWYRQDDADTGTARFLRTVNPAGDRQSISNLVVRRATAELAITNGDFSSWSGGNPVGWTVATSGTGGTVTQAGNTAVITANAGGTVRIYQAISLAAQFAIQIKVDAVSGADGNARVWQATSATIMTATRVRLWPSTMAAGTYTVAAAIASGANGLAIEATDGASITVDLFRVWDCQETVSMEGATGYLIDGIVDAPPAWSWADPPAPYQSGPLGGTAIVGVGVYSQDNPTISDVLAEVLGSDFGDTYTDENGTIRLAWMTPPEEIDSSDAEYLGELAERDIYGELSVADDYAPRLSDHAEYRRNYAQHTEDQVLPASSDLTYLVSEGLSNKLDVSSPGAGDAAPFHPFYTFAIDAPPIPRVLTNEFTDAGTPAAGVSTRDNRLIMLHRCYAARRRFYRFRLSRDKFDELSLRPGGVCEVTHRRYGLSSGKNLLCVAVEPQLMSPTVAVTFWG